MGPPHHVKERIAESKQRKPRWHHQHIKRGVKNPASIVSVHCKSCGAVLVGPMPDEDEPTRTIFTATPLYAEIEITFDDGSKHVTHLCKVCRNGLTVADLEDLYAADLAEFEEDEKHGDHPAPWGALGGKTPVSFRKL
jgi:hypothetical protein